MRKYFIVLLFFAVFYSGSFVYKTVSAEDNKSVEARVQKLEKEVRDLREDLAGVIDILRQYILPKKPALNFKDVKMDHAIKSAKAAGFKNMKTEIVEGSNIITFDKTFNGSAVKIAITFLPSDKSLVEMFAISLHAKPDEADLIQSGQAVMLFIGGISEDLLKAAIQASAAAEYTADKGLSRYQGMAKSKDGFNVYYMHYHEYVKPDPLPVQELILITRTK